MKFSVLLLAVWLQLATPRRLGDSINNEIEVVSNPLNSRLIMNEAPVPILTKPMGSRVELECQVSGSPVPSIQWLKGNTRISTDVSLFFKLKYNDLNSNYFFQDDSFESNLVSNLASQGIANVKSRLVISRALKIHESLYTCVAESGSQIVTASSRLFVPSNGVTEMNFTQLLKDEMLGTSQIPRIVSFYISYMNLMGSDIILPCKAIGNPPPSIIWLDQNDQILDNERATVFPDGSLQLKNLRWSDMGEYKCIARNMISEDSIKTFIYPLVIYNFFK